MLTKYEKELINYWKNWKPGMGAYKGKCTNEETEEKKETTKKLRKMKPTSSEIMEEIQFELGLTEEELDDLLIPEEIWEDLEK